MMTKHTRVDGDDVDEFLTEVHESLGQLLKDDAYSGANTLGALCDAVWHQLPDKARSGGKCPTSMCYYQLKAYFRAKYPGQAIMPGTRLSDIRAFSYRDAERALEDIGWKMPARRAVVATWLSALAAALASFILLHPYIGTGGSIAAAAIAWLLALAGFHSVFSGGLPHAETVGDLARAMRTNNLARLIDAGASLSRAEVWRLFTEWHWAHSGPTRRDMSWLA